MTQMISVSVFFSAQVLDQLVANYRRPIQVGAEPLRSAPDGSSRPSWYPKRVADLSVSRH
jgi:hypothetical protein